MKRYKSFCVSIILLKLILCEACRSIEFPCILNGTSGNLTSPNYPGDYPHNTDISWLIKVPHAHTIKLTFKDFNLEISGIDCPYDHVTIYDGASTTRSPVIGKYCGHSIPPEHFSTGTELLVVFISDSNGGGTGFISSYEAIKQVSSCSPNNSNAENANIIQRQSPGTLVTYINKNITDIRCTWRLRAPKGYGIKVTFSSLNFLENTTCGLNSVEIDGGYVIKKSSSFQRFCGNNSVINSPVVKYIPHRTAIIQLKVSQTAMWTSHSFVGSYDFIVKDTNRCSPLNNFNENNNFHLSGRHGNFTFNASNWTNLHCRWQIFAPSDYQIKLRFLDFRLDQSADCQNCSYVQILDGESKNRGRFCGRESPWVIFSTNGFLYVKLFVGMSKVMRFTAVYEAVTNASGRCSMINSKDMNTNIRLEDSSGILMTPNYPSSYPADFKCIWVITVPIQYRIQLHFKVFQLEDYNCRYDYVQIRDGGSSKSPIKKRKLCGRSDVPHDVYSSSNQLWILFKSDKYDHMKGFLAFYKSILAEPSRCSSANTVHENNNIKVVGPSGFLISPNYPNAYPPNIYCTWYITVPKYSKIIVHFFDLSLDPQCRWGYLLALYEGECLCKSLGNWYCANDIPSTVVSSGNSLKVVFKAGSATSRGFNISYHVPVLGPGICSMANTQSINGNLYLNKTSGQVTSPDYPLPYTPGTQCTWYARAPRGFHVQLTITKMDLPVPCVDDYVEVHDGDSSRSPVKGKFCTVKTPKRIYSSGQNMVLKFVSHHSKTRRNHQGFVASYRMILAGNCSVDFDESWNTNLKLQLREGIGIFTSPGYPRNYPPDIRCIWKITAPYGYRVSLKITVMSLQCSTDFVEVKDGLYSSSNRLGKLCGTADYREIKSSGRYLLVHFESAKNSSLGKGFEARSVAIFTGNQKSESVYAKVIIICLVAFACFALVTVSSLCVYWVFKKRCRHRSHSDPPFHDVTALSPLPPPPLDDIPDCLIAEDRPPSYAEAVNDEQEEPIEESPANEIQLPDQETNSQPLSSTERGLDNPAFTSDPPSYASLYGVDPT